MMQDPPNKERQCLPKVWGKSLWLVNYINEILFSLCLANYDVCHTAA